MKHFNIFFLAISILTISTSITQAQEEENRLRLSGELLSDQRILIESPNDWVWNENRLDLRIEKKVAGYAKFYGDVWLRNLGIPEISSSSDLYNKGIIDPYNLEIREAYVELYGFLSKNLDVKIGKQRIAWGTADILNPTDNLNPYDLEDVLDFGRHRGSFALNLNYYLSNNFSVQGVFIPFFQPANMPVGIFGTVFSGSPELPPGMSPNSFSDTISMPRYNLGESSTIGGKFKGMVGGMDFSLSYVWGVDGLPFSTYNTIIPVNPIGGVDIHSELSFIRNHIIGADIAGSIGVVGVWAEGAAFIPEDEVVMTTDVSALFLQPPGSVTQDSTVLKDEAYFKFVVGADYTFGDGSYLNFQYLHGFVHERGRDAINDYFMLGYEKKFFDSKLAIIPIGGGFIISDWEDISQNYAIIYAPQIKYQATDNAELALGAYIFTGKGDNAFVNLKDYNMLSFSVRYSF